MVPKRVDSSRINAAASGYFITGTDTGVGKTLVCAALLRAMLDRGLDALAVKPVQTGCIESGSGLLAEDAETYARLAAPHFPDGYPDTCCRKYIPACSPHLAAEQAGERIDADALTADIRSIAGQCSTVLVEGAGGVAVPLNDEFTMLDLMQRLALPVILVADNKLGMINHTLMSLEAIRNRGLAVHGVIINNTTPCSREDAFLRRDNVKTIASHGDVSILAELPYLSSTEDADERAVRCMVPVAESIALASAANNGDSGLDFDREHLWHPYTSATSPLPTVKVRAARGTRIILDDNTELVDGMASWWCAIHGYNHPVLNRVAREQLGRMSHVMFGGLTHDPAVELGRKLLHLAPDSMEHVFLADSGSVSVEVALKMAMQFMQAKGDTKRTKLLSLRGGYHGDTCGAMSVCDPDGGMHQLFTGLLPQQVFVPRPSCRFDQSFDPASLDSVREALERGGESIAAIICEPIVQGAGGMWFYHPDYLAGLRQLADNYGTLLILDEIATGFGRTGTLFACEWAGIQPDIMCVGKALSGGYMTLAATMATSEVARTVSSGGLPLMHGPTFMGNPLACAAACASLDLLQSSNWQARVKDIEGWLAESLETCRKEEGVADVRVLGAIGVVEMEQPVNVPRLQEYFISRGVWLRPFGKLLYVMPPYVITKGEVHQLGTAMQTAINKKLHQ